MNSHDEAKRILKETRDAVYWINHGAHQVHGLMADLLALGGLSGDVQALVGNIRMRPPRPSRCPTTSTCTSKHCARR